MTAQRHYANKTLWLSRQCPHCRRTGYVAAYPHRESEARRYIESRNWQCLTCRNNADEADRAYHATRYEEA